MLEAPVLTYVAEITVPKIRGFLSASSTTCIILGIFSQFTMIAFLNWRIITLVSSAVPIFAIILLFFVPESPHWLIMKKRDEDAKASMMWLRGWETSYDNIRKEYEELHENLSKARNEKSSFRNNLQEFGRRTFIFPFAICSLSFFIGHFSGMTTLQTYSVMIFTELNAPMDKRLATFFLGALEFLGTLICIIFVNFVGKRKLVFVSTIGCGICFLLTAIYSIVIKNIEVPASNSFNLTNLKLENATIVHESLLESEVLIHNETINGFEKNSIVADYNQYYWIPLTLLLLSALVSHSGIRLLPWMLVGESKFFEFSRLLTNIFFLLIPKKLRHNLLFYFLACCSIPSKNSRSVIRFVRGNWIYIWISGKQVISFDDCIIFAVWDFYHLFLCELRWMYNFFLLSARLELIHGIQKKTLNSKKNSSISETENRTLQEIEDHFAGKKKLPRRLIKKSTIVPETFPKDFNVKNWESNEKFEKYLEQVKSQKNQRVVKTNAEIIRCSECDFDTRL